jgi:hypothetical protein
MPDTFSIILSGGTPKQVAPPMSRLFGIDEKLAGQIAGASPIVLVENLTEDQATGARAALEDLASVGAELILKIGNVGSIPKVGWGGVPKIAGKPATDYTAPRPTPRPDAAPGTFCCPQCGAAFRLVPEPSASPSAAAPGSPPATKPARKPSGLAIKDSGFEEIPLPDSLKSLESPDELPDVPEVPSSPKAAPASPAPPAASPVKGAVPVSQVKPGHSAPMALEDFEAGLASDDDLLTDLDDGLPDVPDEPRQPVAPKSLPKKPSRKPVVQVTGLEDIEVDPLPPPAGGSAAAAKPGPPKPAAGARPAAAKPRAASPAATPAGGDPSERVNIFANKSTNPKMVELLAKIRGIGPEEAGQLASKPLVTVARNISRKQAEVIKQKFNENRISVRLSPVRASQRMKPAE